MNQLGKKNESMIIRQ